VRVAERPKDDPITSSSYSLSLLVWSFILMLTLAWALYDETYGMRPWRAYHGDFVSAYGSFLDQEIPRQREAEQAIRQSAEYQQIEAQLAAAEAVAGPRRAEIDEQMRRVDRRLGVLTRTFQEARGEVTALVYELEIATERSRPARQRDLERARAREWTVDLPAEDSDQLERVQMNYDQLEAEFTRLREVRSGLILARAEVDRPVAELRARRNTYFAETMVGLDAPTLERIRNEIRRMDARIRQIHVEDAGLVDRCQSCHLGMDPAIVPPGVTLTTENVGASVFASHPNPELLRIHDPERFGCSPCHGGNGRATSSVVKGHGRHKYWLWPLYFPENFEAGCQMCHAADAVIEHAPVLNRGKELFRERGCVGCHRFDGFDNEGERLLNTRQEIRRLQQQRRELEIEVPRLVERGDRAPDDATARRLYAEADNVGVRISNLDARVEQLELLTRDLFRERKEIGPNLKEVRMKLRKEWIPYWLANTHQFRPTTKMPQFRLDPDEIEAISAFIWQSGVAGPAPPRQPPGNAARGQVLLETRGCLGCHSVGEGEQSLGGDFAANLSRVGEKASYDYLVRWVNNPRHRTRPYCPNERRDLGPEDYARHGLPFVFDLEHSTCPECGHQLQVQQATVMPSLRLTMEESRDVASYLMTLRRSGAEYPAAPYMDDAELFNRGQFLVTNYGCAGCHEIAGLEEEGRIGTELTTQGSKPIERLDFALLTHLAKRGILPDGSPSPRGKWYDHKGFFEQKLADPAVFEQGKERLNPLERLKMPRPNLVPADVDALTTFLLGSVEPQVPRHLLYRPEDRRADIQEGWWVISKYNCMGCHQIQVGRPSDLERMPQYQGANRDKLPPPLIGAGARLNPDWLAHFLEDPALSRTQPNRNGVRAYLDVRMPTFSFSENEIRKLVRFFEALSSQAQPFLPPKIEPLTPAERQVARELFTHPAAPCLRCHATGDPGHDRTATAPNFLLARERLRPAWTARWMVDPAQMIPGTAMPTGLFRRENGRWVFAGPLPPAAREYTRDHADLLVRYMLLLTPEEQRLLIGRLPAAPRAPAAGGSE
jgi:cytochrome c551/c552